MMEDKEIYNFLIKIQAIAKTGLIYTKDPYALSNYNEINDLSRDFLEHFLEVKFHRPNYFSKNIYPTPNVSVRTLIFNEDRSKILLVREVSSKTYSLPGGWCDLFLSPSESAINECIQEAGAEVEIIRLLGISNRTPFKNPGYIPDYLIFFEGKLISLKKEHEYETDDVGFFDLNNLPMLSRKTSKSEFDRALNASKNNDTFFD